MDWKIKKEVRCNYNEAIKKVTAALKEEGFGVLTTIDVKEKLKEKINVEFDKYIILGACNPTFAHKALETIRDIGVFLPCNVIVYEQKGKTYIAAINPTSTMAVVGCDDLKRIAGDVEVALQKVINSVV